MTKLLESLQYEPVELAFGTSGLRGLVTDMTDLECYINTRGFIAFLQDKESLPDNSIISVAGDLRDSTPRIICTVIQAIADSGHIAEYCGLIPTPALALWAQEKNQAAVVVTGSHIPSDRNGIKFYKVDGEVLKSDETNIKQSVASTRDEIYEQDFSGSSFDEKGMLPSTGLPELNKAVAQNFVDRYKNMFDQAFLSGKKIIVYQHSAVGRDMLVDILTDFGADVVAVDRSEKFIPIDTENVTPENQTYFRSLAQKYRDAFAIVSTDGDSDRPFVIDENGEFHRGDVLGFVAARELGADFAALPITSSDAVDSSLEKANIQYQHTRVGSPYVIEAMSKSDAKLAVGWEVNGGFLIDNDFQYEGKSIEKLPTRDSFLPIFVCLKSAIKLEKTVSELFNELPARYTQAGLIDNFPVEASKKIVEIFSKSGIELAENIFTSDYGFSELNKIDTTDGARLYFQNGDIVHIRPSGNAPQLRIYSIANTQDRADEIVKFGLGDNGLLRKLQATVS